MRDFYDETCGGLKRRAGFAQPLSLNYVPEVLGTGLDIFPKTCRLVVPSGRVDWRLARAWKLNVLQS